MSQEKMFSSTIILFSQCPTRTLCWIIQYPFLFGCSCLSRECYLLFHFLKKELCLGGMHCHLLFCESNGGRDGAAGRERASGPVQWWPLWTEGIQTPRQDKVRGNWPAWSFPWEGGGTRPFIFSQGPRSLGLHLTNKILSGPHSGLWLSSELGDADTQGGRGLVKEEEGGVTWDRQASGVGK